MVNQGTLALVNNGSLPNTSQILLNNEAIFDVSGIQDSVVINNIISDSLNSSINIGTKSLTIGDNSSGTYAGRISGSGELIKEGVGAYTFVGNATNFSGNGIVRAGQWIHNGQIGGTFNVESGSTLSGNGAFNHLIIDTGAKIAPGNSIGVLTVNGNYVQNPNSEYVVEITSNGQSDLINVSGSAQLNGGQVSILPISDSSYKPTRYTILSAAKGVNGKYGGIIQTSMPFLNLALNYDAQNVYLDIVKPGIDFVSVAITANEIATANAIERLGENNAVYDAVLASPSASSARDAFDLLSGEIYASLPNTWMQNTIFLRNSINKRMHSIFTNIQAFSAKQLELWSEFLSSSGHIDKTYQTDEVDQHFHALYVGVDYQFDETMYIGFATGIGGQKNNISKLNSMSDSNDYNFAIYAGKQFKLINASAGIANTWHHTKVKRQVIFPYFNETLHSDFRGRSTQVFTEISSHDAYSALKLKPILNAAYIYTAMNHFNEKGGAAALGGKSSQKNLISTVGLSQNLKYDHSEAISLQENLFLGWQHLFGDNQTTAHLNFISDNSAFNIIGAPLSNNAMLLNAGIESIFNEYDLHLRLAYIGQFSSHSPNHAITGAIQWKLF